MNEEERNQQNSPPKDTDSDNSQGIDRIAVFNQMSDQQRLSLFKTMMCGEETGFDDLLYTWWHKRI